MTRFCLNKISTPNLALPEQSCLSAWVLDLIKKNIVVLPRPTANKICPVIFDIFKKLTFTAVIVQCTYTNVPTPFFVYKYSAYFITEYLVSLPIAYFSSSRQGIVATKKK
jgi:hypothetical protein